MDRLAVAQKEQSWVGRVRVPVRPVPVCIAAGLWLWCGALGTLYVLLRQGYWFSSVTGVLGPVPLLALCLVEVAVACLVVATGPVSAPIRRFVGGMLAFLAAADALAMMRGETHCGCFGVVSPPIWLVAATNLLLAALLWCCVLTRRSWRNVPSCSARNARGYLVATMVAVPIALPGLLGQTFHDLLRRDVVVLEPRDWIGRSFPVALLTGSVEAEFPLDGVVVLYRSDCDRCCRILRSLPAGSGALVLVDLAYGVGSCPAEQLAELLGARALPLRKDATLALRSVPQFVSLRRGVVRKVSDRPPVGRRSRVVAHGLEPNK